jgi:hypothetical protein
MRATQLNPISVVEELAGAFALPGGANVTWVARIRGPWQWAV